MVVSMKHRGPDGSGTWISDDGKLGLGHNRLAVIDTAPSGAQPMHYLDRYVITYNGEIYNYGQLREECKKAGIGFTSTSDTEVILALYHQKGEVFLQDLDGMFAFAIYDKVNSELFCARDRYGEKPFCYHADFQSFHFASELKALWVAGVKKEISEEGIYHFLANDAVDESAPFYKDIKTIPPGHFIKINFEQNQLAIRVKSYYDINAASTSIWDGDHLRGLIQKAVQSRLVSDVGYALTMSGGVDSAINVFAASQVEKDPQTYGLIYPGKPYNEADQQDLLHTRLKTRHTQFPYHEFVSEDDFIATVRHHEWPIIHQSMFAQNFLYKRVREHGHKVLLEGQGADEIFGGYFYMQRAYIKTLWESGRKVNAGYHFFHWLQSRLLSDGMFESSIAEGLHPDFVHAFKDQIHKPAEISDFTNGRLVTLLRYADINAMMYGLEVRMPFLESSLVDYALHLENDIKFKKGIKKWPLRSAFDGDIPRQVLWQRQKIGFMTQIKIDPLKKPSNNKGNGDVYFDLKVKLTPKMEFKKHVLKVLLS